jgi:hypothetical protein
MKLTTGVHLVLRLMRKSIPSVPSASLWLGAQSGIGAILLYHCCTFIYYMNHQNCNGVYTLVISYIILLCNNTSSVIADIRIIYIICIYNTEYTL